MDSRVSANRVKADELRAQVTLAILDTCHGHGNFQDDFL